MGGVNVDDVTRVEGKKEDIELGLIRGEEWELVPLLSSRDVGEAGIEGDFEERRVGVEPTDLGFLVCLLIPPCLLRLPKVRRFGVFCSLVVSPPPTTSIYSPLTTSLEVTLPGRLNEGEGEIELVGGAFFEEGLPSVTF